MPNIVKCRIDLNQYEAIREGEEVAFEAGWGFEHKYPLVRPSFGGFDVIGCALTTEKIWDRHRPANWFTPWRIFTQPFRPAMRAIWVSCPNGSPKTKVVQPGHIERFDPTPSWNPTGPVDLELGAYGL